MTRLHCSTPPFPGKGRASTVRHGFGPFLGRVLPWLCLSVPLAVPALARDARTVSDREGTAKVSAESPIRYAGIPYQPANRRDPFWHPERKKSGSRPGDEEVPRGVPPPGISGTYISQAALEGISLRDDRKTAVIRAADARAYFLREGDRLFDGYLKTIHEDSVTLVRETKMRSGKTVAQEVTKRLRTP